MRMITKVIAIAAIKPDAYCTSKFVDGVEVVVEVVIVEVYVVPDEVVVVVEEAVDGRTESVVDTGDSEFRV